MPAAGQGLTGKASSMTWNTHTIAITKAAPKGTKSMADSTDSSNYDSVTGQLFKAQLPGDVQITLDVEGFFDRTTTPTNLLAAFFSDTLVAATVALDGSTTLISGNFDLSDFSLDITVPGAVVVSYTATLMSNGKYVTWL